MIGRDRILSWAATNNKGDVKAVLDKLTPAERELIKK